MWRTISSSPGTTSTEWCVLSSFLGPEAARGERQGKKLKFGKNSKTKKKKNSKTKQDYSAFVAAHRAAGADITVAALPCEEKDAEAFGVMKIDGSGRIVEFAEKVKGDALRAMRVDTSVLGIDAKRAAEAPYIASMGIYVAKASAIRELLSTAFPSANDFGSEVIPGATAAGEFGFCFLLPFFSVFFIPFLSNASGTNGANEYHPLEAAKLGSTSGFCFPRYLEGKNSLSIFSPSYLSRSSPLAPKPKSKQKKQKQKTTGMHVQAYAYDGYWEDIGTIQAFYDANLALTDAPDPKFSFYDRDAPIYTMSRFLPPSKVGSGSSIERSILGDGCVVRDGCTIAHSVVGLRSLIGAFFVFFVFWGETRRKSVSKKKLKKTHFSPPSQPPLFTGANCEVTDTLMMGSDYYETIEECVNVRGCLPIGLGDGCVVRRAIIDKNARIGDNVQIVNKGKVQEANKEEDGYVIKDGIVIVIKDSVIAPGTVI